MANSNWMGMGNILVAVSRTPTIYHPIFKCC